MSEGQFPIEERDRVAALAALDLEAARPGFERIARLTQCVAGAPMVHVAIMQADTLWLAGVSDRVLPAVSRRHSFTEAVIRRGSSLWVEDASRDERFSANPFVTGSHQFRFFAGAPIRLASGVCIGVLSIFDRTPRVYDALLAERLNEFAALVADDCERRRALSLVIEREVEAGAATENLNAIIETAPVALAMTDRDLNIIRASARWRRRAARWIDGDVVGRPIHDITPGARHAWTVIRDRGLQGLGAHMDRARFVSPGGVARWVSWETTPWRDANGEVGGLLVMVHEITDMVKALEQSERSEQRLKLATEMADLRVWEIDFRGKAGTTDGVASIYGDERSALLETAGEIWNAIHPADRPGVGALWARHLEDGTPFRPVVRMMQLNGPHIWVSVAAEALTAADGTLERVVGVVRNVDREKRAERAMTHALGAAEAANRAKSEFLANMSHEIRTPLNGVMGIAGALARTHLEPDQREMVGLIENSAGVLASLLGDVLDTARIEAGKLELCDETFDLAASLRAVAALFEPRAAEKGLAFDTSIAPAAEAMVSGDPVRLRQIVSNLLSNAVKFTNAGRVCLQVEAARSIETVSLRLTVRDTGIGFDAQVGAKLFKRFEQADGSITRRFGGTGLGLAISRSIAEAMGGALEAVSQPGQGAAFTLFLDLPRARGEGAATRADATRALAEAETLMAGPKVLLAEDHPTNRKVVALILEAVGVELTVVEDGQAAVEATESNQFDVILMDMQMPVMDGLTAIRLIREREQATGVRRTPILALTANAMPEHARASAEAGADGHLSKPIAAASLVEAVHNAVESTGDEPKADARAVASTPH
jgi:PAS domain S-box-containing protein